MKHLLTIIILCITFSASSQIKIGYTIGIGETGAIDTNSDLLQPAPKFGYNIGLAVDVKIFDDVSIEPIFMYSKKGWNENNNLGIETARDLHYLSTQLIAKYHLTEGFNFIAGPELGYLMKVKSRLSNQPLSGALNNKEISFFVGMEVLFRDIVSLHIKYNFGLNSVTEGPFIDVNGNLLGSTSIKNRMIMYGMTFYPFKRDSN